MSEWFSSNWPWILFVATLLVLQNEFKKVHRRIDAIITLLRNRGVDIYRND